MNWAQRLKLVFTIDIETCSECGGKVKIIASIEDPAVIRKILAHLDAIAASAETSLLLQCRAPPAPGVLVLRNEPNTQLAVLPGNGTVFFTPSLEISLK